MPSTAGPSGYQCGTCGSWVQYGFTHMCGGSPGLSNLPGSISVPPCRAPFNPLNPEMVRLIIREELERYFAASEANR